MTLYHHLGMEARHLPTTFETPQDSETKQNPCGLTGIILGSKDTQYSVGGSPRFSRVSKGEEAVFWACQFLKPVPKAGADTVFLLWKAQHLAQSKHLMQLQAASALNSSLSEDKGGRG